VALENLELRGAVDRRAAERDTAAARAHELEAAVQTIAHDLRSPLGAMLGYAELLEDTIPEDSEDAGDARAFARTIIDSGRRMADQIERMLSIYKITNRELVTTRVDLSAIGRAVVDELRPAAHGRQVRFDIEDGLVAHADPVLTHLLVENLLGNALKYTGKETSARIELGRVELGRVGVPDTMSTFYVRDNGDGFDPTDAERLFRPMARLHTDDEFPGTGLGLASVARIVELHGGQVRAEGEKTVGASFFFSLPA